jgi:hypothetical protein
MRTMGREKENVWEENKKKREKAKWGKSSRKMSTLNRRLI